MKKVTVYCGESIQKKCGEELHPVAEVQRASALINSDKNEFAYSNCADFISAIKYIGMKHGVETEFFLNGVSCGSEVEPIFKDLNRAIDLINELGV